LIAVYKKNLHKQEENMNENFMKEKPVFSLLISMSLPMVISMLVNSLYNIVDSFFVAQISEDAMTALSLVYPVQNFINAVGIGFGIGVNAVIAFHLGAGEVAKADKAATQGMVIVVIHGIIITIVSIAIIPAFLRMFTSSETIINLGVRYSVIAFAFSLIIILGVTFEKIFQSVGSMKVTMVSLMCGCVINIILDPLLIFGIGPFPQMGIEGAALATGIGQTLTLAIYLAVYIVRPIRVHISRKYLLPNKKIIMRLYSIGIPATLNLALPSLLISSLNAILAAYSEVYILVLGIYYKLQTFLYLPANGIIQGMRPLVGYNYGAGEHKRVSQIYNIVLCMSGIIMIAGTAICLIIPGQLISLFTQNQETIIVGKTALRIISAGFIVSAVSVTSSGALEGLGKGTPSLIISLFRYVIIIIPAAFFLSKIFGPVGVWNAFWISETITAAVSYVIYSKSVKIK
jgi:putative MATE family efflux protein